MTVSFTSSNEHYFFTDFSFFVFSKPPTNWKQLDEIGRVAAEAIKSNTTSIYKVGSSAALGSISGGGSDDFAFNAGYNFSYTIELSEGPEKDGFHPPASMIENLVKEAWVGIRAMIQKIIEIGQN